MDCNAAAIRLRCEPVLSGQGIERSVVKNQLVLGLAVSALLLISGCAGPTGSSTSGPSQAAATPARISPAAETDAEAVAKVVARSATDPVGVASADIKSKIDPNDALPAGSTMTPKPVTWAPDSLGGGTMTALMKAPGRKDQMFLVQVTKEAGDWKISGTWPMAETASPTTRK